MLGAVTAGAFSAEWESIAAAETVNGALTLVYADRIRSGCSGESMPNFAFGKDE